jgi:hypothetical protein
MNDPMKNAEYWAWAAEECRKPDSPIANKKRALRQFQDLCAVYAARAQGNDVPVTWR